MSSHAFCVSLNGVWIFRTNSGTVPGSSPSLALSLSIQTWSQMIRGKQLEIMHLSLLSPNIGLRSMMLLTHPGPSYAPSRRPWISLMAMEPKARSRYSPRALEKQVINGKERDSLIKERRLYTTYMYFRMLS